MLCTAPFRKLFSLRSSLCSSPSLAIALLQTQCLLFALQLRQSPHRHTISMFMPCHQQRPPCVPQFSQVSSPVTPVAQEHASWNQVQGVQPSPRCRLVYHTTFRKCPPGPCGCLFVQLRKYARELKNHLPPFRASCSTVLSIRMSFPIRTGQKYFTDPCRGTLP